MNDGKMFETIEKR